MKFKRKFFLNISAASIFIALAGSVSAQSLSLGADQVEVGETAVIEITWVSDGSLSGVGASITYDETSFTADVSNCLASLAEPHASGIFTSCAIQTPGTIFLNVNDDDTGELVSQTIGSISFTVLQGTAVSPPGYTIGVTIQDATNTGGGGGNVQGVTPNSGAITVLEAPPEPEPTLAITPASIAFGPQDLNNLPLTSEDLTPEQAFTVTNPTANTSLTLAAPTLSGTDFTIAAGSTCEAGVVLGQGGLASCTIIVQFEGGVADPNEVQGDLTVSASVPAQGVQPVGATVTGTRTSAPDLAISPSAFSLLVGQSSGGQVVNNGSADGTFSCALFDVGGVAGAITIDPSPVAATLAPAESEPFTVSCAGIEVGETSAAELSCTGDLVQTVGIQCSAEPVVVPTMQNWGLILMALMMMLVGGFSIRFFRA